MFVNKKMIFLYTVHHTGTWFFIEFLKGHPEVSKFYLMKEFVEVDDWICDDKIALHNHVHLNRPDLYKEWKKVPTLFTNHYYNDAFVETFPTIIPTRDPLLSLITRHKRHDDWSHQFIVEGFCELAHLSDHPKVQFMPLDLMTDENVRMDAFEKMCHHCGINFDDFSQDYVKSWTPQNTKPDKYNFKQMYAERDAAGIREVLGENYDMLVSKKDVIRPLLEKLGYENLIWWENEN